MLVAIAGCSPAPGAMTATAGIPTAWTPPLNPTPGVLYADDFQGDQSGWRQPGGSGVQYQYAAGQYLLSRPAGNDLNYACAGQDFKDAVMTVDVTQVAGDPGLTGSLILWRATLCDSQNSG